MHRIVRKVNGELRDHHVSSLVEARAYIAKWGGEIWYYCPTHGWVPGELCKYTHRR